MNKEIWAPTVRLWDEGRGDGDHESTHRGDGLQAASRG